VQKNTEKEQDELASTNH